MKIRASAITTYDNPYDPFDDFVHWFIFDESSGYHTCSYLARVLDDSDSLTVEEASIATENAIDEIIKYDFENVYRKVVKEMDEEFIAS